MIRYANLIKESMQLTYDRSDLSGEIAGIHHYRDVESKERLRTVF